MMLIFVVERFRRPDTQCQCQTVLEVYLFMYAFYCLRKCLYFCFAVPLLRVIISCDVFF